MGREERYLDTPREFRDERRDNVDRSACSEKWKHNNVLVLEKDPGLPTEQVYKMKTGKTNPD